MIRSTPSISAAVLAGILAACSDDASAPPPPNGAPEIATLAVAPDPAAPGGTITAAVAASDPDGDPLTYEWLVPAGWTVQGAADGATLVLQAPGAHGEAAFVRVDVKDGRGGAASQLAALRTSPAGAVQLRSLAAGPSPVPPGGRVVLEAVAETSGGGAIAYAWAVSDPAWALTASGSSATLVAPYAYDRAATVTVTASEGESAPATGKVVVATAPTAPPAIASLTATPASAAPGGAIQLAAEASGAYGLGVTYAWSVASDAWTLAAAGARASLVAPGAANAGTTVKVTVTDAAGAVSSSTVSVRTTDPTPVVSSIEASPATVAPGGSSTLSVLAASPAGRTLSYAWSLSDGAWTLSGTGPIVTVTAPLAYGRVALATVTVDDGEGWSATATTVVASSAPAAPVVAALTASPAAVPPGGASQLAIAATSPSGLALSYAWSCASGAWTITGSGSTVAIRAPAVPLQATSVTVVITDAAGASTSATMPLSTLDSTPVFRAVAASPDPVAPGGTASVTADAASPVGNALSYEWSVSDPAWTLTASGRSASLVAPSAYDRSAVVTVAADDGKGGRATATVLVSTSEHEAPVVSSLVATPSAAAPGGSLAVLASASSPSGLALTYLWSASAGWSVTGSGASATVIAPAASGSAGTVTVTVSDAAGASSSSSVQVATVDSTPVFRAVSAAPSPVAPGGAVTVSAAVESPIAAPLTYAWTRSSGAWALSPAGDGATLTAPMAYGEVVVVTVEATDPYGARASDHVVVSTAPLAAPSITSLDATASVVDPGGRIDLAAAGTSPAGLPLTWSWTLAGDGWAVAGSGANAVVTAPLVRSSRATVTVTAADAAGASSSRSLALATNEAPPTTVSAAVAGAAPHAGVVGAPVLLDASGSTSTGGGTLLFEWRVTSAPAGAAATLEPSASGATAAFTGSAPGLYGVEVAVVDAEGARGVATSVVSLEGASTVEVAAGDAQTGTAGEELELPLEAVVRAPSGAAVPGARVAWRIAGGRFLSTTTTSDATGAVRATVRLGRIAAAGSATVALRDAPSASASFTFTGQAGVPASVAVRAEPGTADTGLLVRVRTVDAYGNESTDPSVESSTFALSVSSASGGARFGADVEAGVGVLLSGAGTGSVVGQLAGGRLDVRVTDPTAEDVTLSLGRDPGATALLPFSAWRTILLDSADRGVAGWSLDAGVEPWAAVGEARAASPSQGFGIELSAATAVVPGTSAMSRALGALPDPMVRVDLVHRAAVTSATDSADRCTAQPALAIAMRDGAGAESPIRPAPVAGWPVQDACDGRDGFAATSGFEAVALDLTDATAAGYTTLSFEVASSPRAATAVAPVAWYVDDVLVQALAPAAWSGATAEVGVRPGVPASVVLSSSTTWPVLYGECTTGTRPYDLTATIVDANGNAVEESTWAFGIAWTGSARLTSVSTGTLHALGASEATVGFDGGRAALRFEDGTAEAVTFSLSDPEGRGVALGADWAGAFKPYFCHSTGTGYSWSDTVGTGSFSSTQAMRACETHYGQGRCGLFGPAAAPTGYAYTCTSIYRWQYAYASGPCNGNYPGYVNPGYWANYYYSGSYYYCANCGYEGSWGWVQTGGTSSWY